MVLSRAHTARAAQPLILGRCLEGQGAATRAAPPSAPSLFADRWILPRGIDLECLNNSHAAFRSQLIVGQVKVQDSESLFALRPTFLSFLMLSRRQPHLWQVTQQPGSCKESVTGRPNVHERGRMVFGCVHGGCSSAAMLRAEMRSSIHVRWPPNPMHPLVSASTVMNVCALHGCLDLGPHGPWLRARMVESRLI